MRFPVLAATLVLVLSSGQGFTQDAITASVHPAGTLTRPSEGIQHPALDKAWAAYDSEVDACQTVLGNVISTRLDAAAASGDLGQAEKWQAALEAWKTAGTFPVEAETPPTTAVPPNRKPLRPPQAEEKSLEFEVGQIKIRLSEAEEKLRSAYESVVKTLTMNKEFAAARKVKDEIDAIVTRLLTPKPGSRDSSSTAGNGPMPAVFLSSLPARNVSVGYGELGLNGELGYEGRRVSIGGRKSRSSISMHPPSKGVASVVFSVPSGYTHLKSSVAINDEFVSTSPLTFKVMGDGRLLWVSQPFKEGTSKELCEVAVGEVKEVTLVVECPGRNGWAGAVWVEPSFVTKQPTE